MKMVFISLHHGFVPVERMWGIRDRYSSSSKWRETPYRLYFTTSTFFDGINSSSYEEDIFMSSRYKLNPNYKNSKWASDLLYDEKWVYYVDETWADYAVGSPTLEMFIESYCEKNSFNATYTVGTKGYGWPTVRNSDGAEVNLGSGKQITDPLYWIKGSENWCLSSTSNLNEDCLWQLSNSYTQSNLTGNSTTQGGVRPVVHLRADVRAKKDEETGKWILQ